MRAASLDPSALIDALRVETAGYRALVTVLEAERDALRDADADALSTLIAVKLDHLSALHGLASARSAEIARCGWADMDSALAALAATPDGDGVAREWATLLALAVTARRLNDANGGLVANRQRHFDTAARCCRQPAPAPCDRGRRHD